MTTMQRTSQHVDWDGSPLGPQRVHSNEGVALPDHVRDAFDQLDTGPSLQNRVRDLTARPAPASEDLTALMAEVPRRHPQGEATIDELLEWVGYDPLRAQAALAVEQNRDSTNKRLLEQLGKRTGSP